MIGDDFCGERRFHHDIHSLPTPIHIQICQSGGTFYRNEIRTHSHSTCRYSSLGRRPRPSHSMLNVVKTPGPTLSKVYRSATPSLGRHLRWTAYSFRTLQMSLKGCFRPLQKRMNNFLLILRSTVPMVFSQLCLLSYFPEANSPDCLSSPVQTWTKV